MSRPLAYREVSRDQINKFLDRAIADAAANGVDREYGFQVMRIEINDEHRTVRFDLDNGDLLFIDLEHLVPRNS